jgi:hypothetical protein
MVTMLSKLVLAPLHLISPHLNVSIQLESESPKVKTQIFQLLDLPRSLQAEKHRAGCQRPFRCLRVFELFADTAAYKMLPRSQPDCMLFHKACIPRQSLDYAVAHSTEAEHTSHSQQLGAFPACSQPCRSELCKLGQDSLHHHRCRRHR